MVALRRVESYNTQRSRQWEPKGEAVDCVAERALTRYDCSSSNACAAEISQYVMLTSVVDD